MNTDPDDPFATSDAAYVLGILDLPERRAFELHLQTCDRCVASVSALRGLPELMSLYTPPELAADSAGPDGLDLPETLLPRLLDEVGRQRRRRRIGLAAVATTAVAASVAAVVLLVSSGGSGHKSVPPLAMSAVVTTPVHATAVVQPVAWGTKIDLHCSYDTLNYAPGLTYGLVVVDRNNVSHQLGDWQIVPGRDTDFTGGTSLTRAEIAQVEVTTSSGKPVLNLAL